MHYNKVNAFAFLLLASMNTSFPMDTVPREVKEVIAARTLPENESEEAGYQQLARLSGVSLEWYDIARNLPQKEVFKEIYRYVPVFYPVSSTEEALRLLKEGIINGKYKAKLAPFSYYFDLNNVTIDSTTKGMFWHQNEQRVAVLVNRDTAMVYNSFLRNKLVEQPEYVQSKMSLFHYMQQKIEGKKLKDKSNKKIIYDKITAKPSVYDPDTASLQDRLAELASYDKYYVETFIETPIPADKLIKTIPHNKSLT